MGGEFFRVFNFFVFFEFFAVFRVFRIGDWCNRKTQCVRCAFVPQEVIFRNSIGRTRASWWNHPPFDSHIEVLRVLVPRVPCSLSCWSDFVDLVDQLHLSLAVVLVEMRLQHVFWRKDVGHFYGLWGIAFRAIALLLFPN